MQTMQHLFHPLPLVRMTTIAHHGQHKIQFLSLSLFIYLFVLQDFFKNATEVSPMNANIDLSASKGQHLPYKHGVLMEYKLSSHIIVLLQAFSHIRCSEQQENRGWGQERDGRGKGRDRAAAEIGERRTGKMKQGEERRHAENSNENEKCVEGRVKRGTECRLPE